VFLWKFAHFGLVFRICLPAFLFHFLVDFSFCWIFLPTHVELVFRLNYRFLACFSNLLACFCKITWHHWFVRMWLLTSDRWCSETLLVTIRHVVLFCVKRSRGEAVAIMSVRRNFSRGAKSTFCLSFSDCWRCNANGHIKKGNVQCYGNSCIQCFPC